MPFNELYQSIVLSACLMQLLNSFSSALDINNEEEIINNLKQMNKTIIYITHRSKHMEESKIIHLKES